MTSGQRRSAWAGLCEVCRQALAEPSIVGGSLVSVPGDQPVTGRLLDGENGHFGMIGITDLPFTGFVERA